MISDNSAVKKKLTSLSEINVESVKTMTNKQLFNLVQALNVTAATFPMQKEELEYAFGEMDYATVYQWLKIISSSLSQVHADELAHECEKFLNTNHDLNNIRHERVKVFIDYFIPTLDLFFTDAVKVLDELEVEAENADQQHRVTGPDKIKGKLLTIKELNSEIIKDMSDEELADYIQVVNGFHAEFQAQETGLTSSIKIKHYVFVIQWLTAIEETLTKLHATELAEDCRHQINYNKDFKSIRHEKLEVFVKYFISSLSMLSSDIKMLQLPKQILSTENSESTIEHIEVEVELLSHGSSPDAKTILVINKMMMFLNSLKNALGDTGHKLIAVTSAEAAVGYLKAAKPDLFILDEDLPGTDSNVLIKIIRATGQMAPIIITTSKITKDKMVGFMEAGVADFIMKPITPADVIKKVDKHLL